MLYNRTRETLQNKTRSLIIFGNLRFCPGYGRHGRGARLRNIWIRGGEGRRVFLPASDFGVF